MTGKYQCRDIVFQGKIIFGTRRLRTSDMQTSFQDVPSPLPVLYSAKCKNANELLCGQLVLPHRK